MQKMLNPTPPKRYIPTTPYLTNTQFELDMRRKAEILKYQKNNSQTNQQTKKQKFTYLVSKPTGGITTSSTKARQCAAYDNLYKPLPNYFSGVPGPTSLLWYDASIPLYNYNPPLQNLSLAEGEQNAAIQTL
jgi:hypothetical protein